ncbi:MAG: hypothetical protein AAF368_00165 [Planctomycetota bacterium]
MSQSRDITPAADVVATIMAMADTTTISDNEAKRLERLRSREQRAERLRRYRHVISSEDAERIVRRKLDSQAWGHVVDFMKRWRKGRARFLWLCGLKGRGKTVACMGALAEIGGVYITAEDARRAFAQETDEARELRFKLRGSQLVILDDAGTERDALQAKHAVYQTVNQRQGRGMATLLTSNISIADVYRTNGRYDERAIARVEHQGAIIEVGGEDLRRHQPRRQLGTVVQFQEKLLPEAGQGL